jgi:hypothetical protein
MKNTPVGYGVGGDSFQASPQLPIWAEIPT